MYQLQWESSLLIGIVESSSEPSRRPLAQCQVGPERVVAGAPGLDGPASVSEIGEPVHIQALTRALWLKLSMQALSAGARQGLRRCLDADSLADYLPPLTFQELAPV